MSRTFRIGRVSWRMSAHAAWTGAALGLGTLVVGAWALQHGEYPLALRAVLDVLAGGGDADTRMVVWDWRLPRVVLAMLVGTALGASGAIFQSLTRNALGSPDVIGFNTGAATGALAATLFASASGYAERALSALGGGALTALAVYLLSYQRGIQGARLVLVGIGVGAMLLALNNYLILQVDTRQAMHAAVWLVGSLSVVGWPQVTHVAAAVALLLPLAIALGRPMQVMEMGDDSARSLGVDVEAARLALLAVGVGLVAVSTAAAGPIAFVSLAAPQLARRVTRTAGTSVLPSALMGALLLSVSDWIARHAFAPKEVPVGAITVSVGGLYLVWLLAQQRNGARNTG